MLTRLSVTAGLSLASLALVAAPGPASAGHIADAGVAAFPLPGPVPVLEGVLDGLGAGSSHGSFGPSLGPSLGPSRGVWPLLPQPEVVHHFDPPAVRWGAGHRGADLAGHVGQPVRAALRGTVSFVGRIAGRGVVVISHGATRTTYQPVLPTVAAGDRVGVGEVVARLAGFGSHCAPRACLHWGLRRGDDYLDPLTLVDAPRPVRLLPW